MDFFDALSLLGGLCLFLFGMNVMGQALERCAGDNLRTLIGKLTTRRMTGFLTGLGVTAVIQSSSATTVMVVGFVNSGIMTLGQAINVIMGANVGTTVTAWLLSLGGISSSNPIVQMLKPTSFTPILALIGIIFTMFSRSDKKKDTGTIFLGFATLMAGMETMSSAVAGLKDVPAFRELFVKFQNPILGLLAGAVLTAIIQSSSASVGILQALTVTGQISYAAAIPIIMGQNIGTCITAILSSFGTNKNARRAAMAHLFFNIIGSTVLLSAFTLVRFLFPLPFFDTGADRLGIAVAHTAFNLLCTSILLPMSGLLEKLVCRLVPDGAPAENKTIELDERLLATPPLALERCQHLAGTMANLSVLALREGIQSLREYSPALAEEVRRIEDETDHYEDLLSTFLVRLSHEPMSAADSREATGLLRAIGDFERIGDHAVNLLESAEELKQKGLTLTAAAQGELAVLSAAVDEILTLTLDAFLRGDPAAACKVEPLEEVIDRMKEQLRTHHILRMQQGICSIEAGFVWCDLLTDLERVSDHCSNIAGCIIDLSHNSMNLHESLKMTHSDPEFLRQMETYSKRYALPG